jgi:hypothetical protein
MSTPNIYRIKPEHLGGDDVMQFLRRAVAREFDGRGEYFIVGETTMDRPTPYSLQPRKLVCFNVEHAGDTTAVYFDISDVSTANSVNWLGNR